jgi:dTDP-4-dehydrorhamnose reductase
VAPLGVYGASKEEGERLVRAAHDHHLILRTSWVYSPWGSNFVRTMLRYGAERLVMRVVADQHGKPTSAADLSSAILAIAARMATDRDVAGTYHFANEGVTSWHGFASGIFAGAACRGAKVPERVEAITTADYPTPARRPANSALSTDSLTTDFGIGPRSWQNALDDVLDALLRANEG